MSLMEVDQENTIVIGRRYDDKALLLDKIFLDSWIDNIENFSQRVKFNNIHTITIQNCQLNGDVSYDIFCDFVNIQQLNIIHSNFNSESLTTLLTYINPYSLLKLDLSGSTFSSFSEDDFISINSLFALSELILPTNTDDASGKILRKLFALE